MLGSAVQPVRSGATMQSGWAQCSPPQDPAQAAAGGQAAHSPGFEVLDLPQLPAGSALWPPEVGQGAGQLPCGALCSHGPENSKGRIDLDSAGLGHNITLHGLPHPWHIFLPPQQHSTYPCLRHTHPIHLCPHPVQPPSRSHPMIPS